MEDSDAEDDKFYASPEFDRSMAAAGRALAAPAPAPAPAPASFINSSLSVRVVLAVANTW